MQSFREPAKSARAQPSIPVSVPVDLALVVGTIPLLALVVSARAVASGWIELGKASEELFRGDRLPSRPLMNTSEPSEEI